MKRSNLQNFYFKKETPELLNKNTRYRKLFEIGCIKKERKMFFSDLDPAKMRKKTFWKKIQPFFDKREITNKITFVAINETVISDDQ